jgi:tetratricopeptide (TPR) repeat protein
MAGRRRARGVGSHAGRAAIALALGVLGGVPRAAIGSPAASPVAEAVALCNQADAAPDGEKRAVLERGLAAAEAAIAADDNDPSAHFAVFCNLGKRMRLDGAAFSSLLSLRRLRREVDRTLELAPNHADALVGKAALLYYTPRVLGGDRAEGERLLRVALAVAPGYVDARLALARMLDARGARDEARATARRALRDARHTSNAAKEAEAQRLVEQLGE